MVNTHTYPYSHTYTHWYIGVVKLYKKNKAIQNELRKWFLKQSRRIFPLQSSVEEDNQMTETKYLIRNKQKRKENISEAIKCLTCVRNQHWFQQSNSWDAINLKMPPKDIQVFILLYAIYTGDISCVYIYFKKL